MLNINDYENTKFSEIERNKLNSIYSDIMRGNLKSLYGFLVTSNYWRNINSGKAGIEKAKEQLTLSTEKIQLAYNAARSKKNKQPVSISSVRKWLLKLEEVGLITLSSIKRKMTIVFNSLVKVTEKATEKVTEIKSVETVEITGLDNVSNPQHNSPSSFIYITYNTDSKKSVDEVAIDIIDKGEEVAPIEVNYTIKKIAKKLGLNKNNTAIQQVINKLSKYTMFSNGLENYIYKCLEEKVLKADQRRHDFKKNRKLNKSLTANFTQRIDIDPTCYDELINTVESNRALC